MADADATPGDARRTVRVLLWLDRAVERRWFFPAVAAFPLSDYLVPVLPNQILLAALSTLHPQRWVKFAATFIAAAGVGALGVATVVQAAGPWLFEALAGDTPDATAVSGPLALVERYGLWVVAALSLLPWPPRTAVLACAVAGLSPWAITLAVLAGRPVPTVTVALVGAKAPHVLRRFRSVDRLLAHVERAREDAR